MNLYEIESAILQCVDQETGDVVDIDRLNALEMERDTKISNIACWIKDLDAEAKAIKEEKDALAKRQKAAENKAESLRNYLTGFLSGAKFKDARCSISYRHSQKTIFEGDVNSLPEDCKKVEVSASLTAIKEHLLNGEVIEGASLVDNEKIQIK